MMNATEARQMAVDTVSKAVTEELSAIMTSIKNMCQNGERRLTWYRQLKPATLNKLEELGYKVQRADSLATQRDSVHYYFSW